MSEDGSLLSALGINVDDLDVPQQPWQAALDAAFNPATAPVVGDVVPVMDDEPRLPDEIDLGDDDVETGDDGHADSPAVEVDLGEGPDETEMEDNAPADTGYQPEDAPDDLGPNLDDDGPAPTDL